MDTPLDKLRRNQRKGSKPRCHWLMHGAPEQVASSFNKLTIPWGFVSSEDHWIPQEFDQVEEAQLHRAHRLLSLRDCKALGAWWLEVQSDDSQTPNWDIASTCTVGGQKGLLLVEAKAHNQELKIRDRVGGSHRNRDKIAECIKETNVELGDQTGLAWALSHEHRYQMANRFAWSRKLTELGYPVILTYLGFLKAEEIRKGREQNPLDSYAEWESLVKAHSERLFPVRVWDRGWIIHGQPFAPRICSIAISYDGPMEIE